jgi:hypothetical protein
LNVLLAAIFASVGLGLFGHKIVRHEMKLAATIAVALVVLYFVHPAFMT